ncbi:MAG: ribulose-phosphate 3-epimerase [Atopobiaceae bacterium]|nr:ribulose-phosphate 3-epimerase [Atopobiaceae bacterium]
MSAQSKLLLPSMMCADFGHLADEVTALETAGADGFHLDLMDGTYVPNYGMGLQDIEWICKNATVPCDVHMMVENPGRYVDKFAAMGAKVIYVHPEADPHVARTLATIRELGVKAGIAINPGTSFSAVEPVLSLCDYVLAMTVNPGFAGQAWLDFVNPKLGQLVAASHEGANHYEVLVDGNCSPERIAQASGMGVRGFVLGTAGLFGRGDYGTTMAALRAL